MELTIEYGVDIIVAVIYRGQWRWYVSEKDYWFLDQEKLRRAFTEAGHPPPEGDADRFNIPIANEATAEQFLLAMDQFRVDRRELADSVRARIPPTSWDDIAHLCPSLLVDFDQKRLVSLFSEPASFEEYVPEDWRGEYRDFLMDIPESERYWITDGQDQLRRFFTSGR